MQLKTGRFATKNIHDIEQVPIWYLKEVLGDVTADGIRWKELSADEQLAVRNEIKRREEFNPNAKVEAKTEAKTEAVSAPKIEEPKPVEPKAPKAPKPPKAAKSKESKG